MVDHYLQKRIIADLVESESARYADLKPEHIEGNVFTYHLKSLLTQGLITKNNNGSYSLTNTGKLYGINSSLRAHELLEQAHAIVLLAIQDGTRWLLRKRLVQPMFGKIGFIHGEPHANETITEAGVRILQYRTGMSGEMKVKGSGFICLKDGSETVAYSSFTLLQVSKLSGTLRTTDPHGENTWYDQPNFSAPDMIPSMLDLAEAIRKPGLCFIDSTYPL